ncbi:hypothetical protein [Marinobacter salicampi]|uniref:hypothetical protein n=1 Tax=Marinobacter salicampi TaxID=435907 RepID=UPI00140E0F7A|nr:hypothetical protein [Marinobacter salicampi]
MKASNQSTSKTLLVVWMATLLAAAIGLSTANSGSSWSKAVSVSFQMGEADSRLTALEGAREKLREMALSQSGAYVESQQILSDERFSESLRLLRSAFVSTSDEKVHVRTDAATQVTTLHLDAVVEVDTSVLRERVQALAVNSVFQQNLETLRLEDKRIAESMDRLEVKVGRQGAHKALLTDYQQVLVEAKERVLQRVAALGIDDQVSLLDKVQYSAGMLELGKLTAMEKYYLDVITPFVADLKLEAEILSAEPSQSVANTSEVAVRMKLTYAPAATFALASVNAELVNIVEGDFWLPKQSITMGSLNLSAYENWVETTLFNMPLLAVVSLGNHQAYYPVLGNRGALKSENGRDPWGYELSYMNKARASEFAMAPAFKRVGPNSSPRTIEHTYTFQVTNAEAAVITNVDAALRIIRATPEA